MSIFFLMCCSLSSKNGKLLTNHRHDDILIYRFTIIKYHNFWEYSSNVAINILPHDAGGLVNELANDIYLVYEIIGPY